MFSKLLANEGFNKFAGMAKSYMGWGALKGAGRHAARGGRAGMNYARSGGKSSYFRDQMVSDLGAGGARLGGWARAGGNMGKSAARIGGAVGGTALGVGAVSAGADFLNPWGLGWGD